MTLQIVRDWVLKLNAHGTAGLVAGKAAGAKPLLTPAHRAALAAMIESGPTAWLHGVVRWRIVDLCRWLRQAFQLGMSPQTLGRELRAMGYRRLSAPSGRAADRRPDRRPIGADIDVLAPARCANRCGPWRSAIRRVYPTNRRAGAGARDARVRLGRAASRRIERSKFSVRPNTRKAMQESMRLWQFAEACPTRNSWCALS